MAFAPLLIAGLGLAAGATAGAEGFLTLAGLSAGVIGEGGLANSLSGKNPLTTAANFYTQNAIAMGQPNNLPTLSGGIGGQSSLTDTSFSPATAATTGQQGIFGSGGPPTSFGSMSGYQDQANQAQSLRPMRLFGTT